MQQDYGTRLSQLENQAMVGYPLGPPPPRETPVFIDSRHYVVTFTFIMYLIIKASKTVSIILEKPLKVKH